jgi:RimJ/RimL family protein N-acetyltransferase
LRALTLPDPPLTDGVVALRAWTAGDVPALVEACRDPEIPRWTLLPDPYTEDSARAWLRRAADGRAAGERIAFAIVATGDAAPLGSVGLNVIDWERGAADAGYWLAAPARGHGVATRAVELVARWAFGTLGLERLELRINPRNAASRAVAGRAGFAPAPRPVVRRPECDVRGELTFARRRR